MSAELGRAAACLIAAERVWLGTHLDPDGDAIGSLLGLSWVLTTAGKEVVAACQDPWPPEVGFLPGVEGIVAARPTGDAVAVALDAADAERLGTLYDAADWARRPTIVLDHHVSNPHFGEINVIEPGLASTAEVVVRVADAMGATIGREAATCLLTGLVTDTVGFRTTNTTAETLDCARRLMTLGASLSEVAQHVFLRRPLASLRLIGRAIERLELFGPIGITTLRLADFAEFGVSPTEMRGISALLSTAAELAVVALLRERPDGQIDLSLRSKPEVNLVPVALALGGGGHPQAAGARLAGPLDAAARAVLAACQARLALAPPEDGR